MDKYEYFTVGTERKDVACLNGAWISGVVRVNYLGGEG